MAKITNAQLGFGQKFSEGSCLKQSIKNHVTLLTPPRGGSLWNRSLCLSVYLSVCLCFCHRDNSKNNARIFTKLSTQVVTLKISDEFEDGHNPSSSSNFITGYLLILVRFSIEIYIKMLKFQLFGHKLLLTSKIQVNNSLGLLRDVVYEV